MGDGPGPGRGGVADLGGFVPKTVRAAPREGPRGEAGRLPAGPLEPGSEAGSPPSALTPSPLPVPLSLILRSPIPCFSFWELVAPRERGGYKEILRFFCCNCE